MGEYGSPPTPFCLYLFPTPLTPPLVVSPSSEHAHFWCLEDLEHLFFEQDQLESANQILHAIYNEHRTWFSKDQLTGRAYVMTRAVATVANKLHLSVLADLCRLLAATTIDDHPEGLQELLQAIHKLRPLARPTVSEQEFVPAPMGDHHKEQEPIIRLSPPSDEYRGQVRFDPCRDDVAASNKYVPYCLWLLSYWDGGLEQLRRRIVHHCKKTHGLCYLQLSRTRLASNQPPKPSSLLLKRLAPKQGAGNRAPPNLTIFTPSYGITAGHGIQTAPLRPKRQQPNKVTKRPQQPSLRATATALYDFPSPPTVPSQQQQRRQPNRQQHHPPKTAMASLFPVNHQKQHFLQPFELLYDTIEQTRSLKSALDDHIRRSSLLIQTLQSSGDMVEALVKRHVREMVQKQFDQRLQECLQRIAWLEERIQPSPTTTIAKDSASSSIDTALLDLVGRLDRLEKKMDT